MISHLGGTCPLDLSPIKHCLLQKPLSRPASCISRPIITCSRAAFSSRQYTRAARPGCSQQHSFSPAQPRLPSRPLSRRSSQRQQQHCKVQVLTSKHAEKWDVQPRLTPTLSSAEQYTHKGHQQLCRCPCRPQRNAWPCHADAGSHLLHGTLARYHWHGKRSMASADQPGHFALDSRYGSHAWQLHGLQGLTTQGISNFLVSGLIDVNRLTCLNTEAVSQAVIMIAGTLTALQGVLPWLIISHNSLSDLVVVLQDH